MINDLYTVQPVNSISKAVALGTYKQPSKVQNQEGYQKFSRMLENAEKKKERIEPERAQLDFALSLYNKEAQLLLYQYQQKLR